jgi:hypothetical protein
MILRLENQDVYSFFIADSKLRLLYLHTAARNFAVQLCVVTETFHMEFG